MFTIAKITFVSKTFVYLCIKNIKRLVIRWFGDLVIWWFGDSVRRCNLTTFGGGRKKIYMCKNVKQNVLFERSEFTFCSFCMYKSRPETKSEDEAPKQRDSGSGPWIFLLRLGIINAGHFDKLSDRIASALAAQEARQAQGPNRTDSPISRFVD